MKKLFFLFTAILFAHFGNAQYIVDSIPYTPPYPFTIGTQTMIGIDDVWSDTINLSFDFKFYGNTYTQLVIGANGVISFDLTNAGGYCPWSFSASVPSSSLPTNAIFGAYHDIDASLGGSIKYSVNGVAPNRAFVINFDSVPQFDCNDLLTTQQIVLYESTNDIEVYIEDKPDCSAWNNGNAVIGIQNDTGLIGLAPPNRNTGAWSATNEAWRFHQQNIGINNMNDRVKNLRIFPNPTTGLFYVYTEEFTKAEIFNSLGVKVMVSNKRNINISNLGSGVYFVKVFTKKGLLMGEILKN